jgi:hypothetical protein
LRLSGGNAKNASIASRSSGASLLFHCAGFSFQCLRIQIFLFMQTDVVLRAYYSESLQEDSRIGLMLKTLAETETSQAMTRIEFEAQNHHWMRKAA